MRTLVLAALLGIPTASVAQSTGPSVDLVVDLAAEYGGDEVAEILFTDGGTQTLRAGQGGTGAIGFRVRPSAPSPLALQATVGYKFVVTAADNTNFRLTRIPVEVIGSYAITPDVWVGAGYVLHTGIRLHGDNLGPDVTFDAAHGVTAEAGWKWIGASVTAIRYTDSFGTDYDASSLGATIRVAVPLR